MRNVTRSATLLLAFVVAAIAIAQQPASRYTPTANDPYAVVATVSAAGPHNFTVHVTVTQKSTGNVVFAPTVTTPANVPAEIISDPAGNRPQFDVRVDVDEAAKATVTFHAVQRLLQRSTVQAVSQPFLAPGAN